MDLIDIDHKLIDELSSEDNQTVENAIKKLIRIGTPALQSMFDRFIYEDWKVKEYICFIFGEIGGPRAIELLIDVLGIEKDDGYSYGATMALVNIGHDAVEPLSQALHAAKSDFEIGSEAAWALASMENKGVLEALTIKFFDRDYWDISMLEFYLEDLFCIPGVERLKRKGGFVDSTAIEDIVRFLVRMDDDVVVDLASSLVMLAGKLGEQKVIDAVGEYKRKQKGHGNLGFAYDFLMASLLKPKQVTIDKGTLSKVSKLRPNKIGVTPKGPCKRRVYL